MGNVCGSCEASSNNPSFIGNSREPEKVIEHKFHQCVIRLSHGDLLRENSDAIVAVIDPSLAFSGHLCRQIMQQAGRSLINDINEIQQKKPNYEYGQVFYTHSGDLDFDFIFFAVLPPHWETDSTSDLLKQSRASYTDRSIQNLNQHILPAHKNQQQQQQFVFQCINEILKQAEDLQLTSVSFPVISAENIKASKNLTATIMLMAIKAFIEENNSTLQHLQTINITILNKSMLSIFKWAFEKIIHGVVAEQIDGSNLDGTKPATEVIFEHKPLKRMSFSSFTDVKTTEINNNNQDNDFQRFGHRCNGAVQAESKIVRKESI